jgi:predicted nucleotidyltransferase
LDADIIADIRRRLAAISTRERVSIPLAIESGSRAWGFPSPDSDYDCRFIYLRGIDDALKLFPQRDVIETPLTPILDVNGWDLRKTVKLLLKGNAVASEWLRSPLTYQVVESFREELLALASTVARRDAIASHYLHLLYSMRDRVFNTETGVVLKKVFYVLRPAMALRWMRAWPEATVVPMNFQELCDGSDLNPAIRSLIDELLVLKSKTRELGQGQADPLMLDFVQLEQEYAEKWIAHPGPPPRDHVALAEETYLRLLRRYGPDSA